MNATFPVLEAVAFPAINRKAIETLQVNVGYRCNQTCAHCHVNAGPTRTESMDRETAEAVIDFVRESRIRRLDITGGAPELNPNFRFLVTEARAIGAAVMDRCNLTILLQPGQEDLAEFLAKNQVEIVASLPCYLEENVDRQRGKGVYSSSIDALRRLNLLGYGKTGTGLRLDLVYNPLGPSLPPPQEKLERDYKAQLGSRWGIEFNHLLTLANMPIHRFASSLKAKDQLTSYMDLLQGAHRDENLDHVMCRSLISVDWQGFVYDCDFNQMLGLPLAMNGRARVHLRDLEAAALEGNPIAVDGHCFGCTAGQGSSCGGALSS